MDMKGHLQLANAAARSLFRVSAKDQGRHFREVEMPVEIQRVLEETYTEVPANVKEDRLVSAEWTVSGERTHYEVSLRSLRDTLGGLAGVSLVLKDISSHRHLQEQLQRSKQELETVSEELQSANEELETTNEELQSTVEELETTNEELQSTNEELETMNEELQSTNEELRTLNDELRMRSDDLNVANAFLGSVLSSVRGGLAVIDRSSQIVAWNRAAEDVWGLRSGEVRNRSLFSLDIGLPVDQLGGAIRASLAGEERTVTLQAITRCGKAVVCEVLCTPLRASEGEIQGTILMMELQEPRT